MKILASIHARNDDCDALRLPGYVIYDVNDWVIEQIAREVVSNQVFGAREVQETRLPLNAWSELYTSIGGRPDFPLDEDGAPIVGLHYSSDLQQSIAAGDDAIFDGDRAVVHDREGERTFYPSSAWLSISNTNRLTVAFYEKGSSAEIESQDQYLSTRDVPGLEDAVNAKVVELLARIQQPTDQATASAQAAETTAKEADSRSPFCKSVFEVVVLHDKSETDIVVGMDLARLAGEIDTGDFLGRLRHVSTAFIPKDQVIAEQCAIGSDGSWFNYDPDDEDEAQGQTSIRDQQR